GLKAGLQERQHTLHRLGRDALAARSGGASAALARRRVLLAKVVEEELHVAAADALERHAGERAREHVGAPARAVVADVPRAVELAAVEPAFPVIAEERAARLDPSGRVQGLASLEDELGLLVRREGAKRHPLAALR